MINDLNLNRLFFCYEKISYEEVSSKMINCDVLLLFDTITEDNQPQPYLPSKILEYIILRKPILTICQKNSPAYQLLNNLKQECLSNDE